MHKWTIFAFMMLGCSTESGEASKPDGGDMSTFDEFSRWGMGMAGFTAPPSNQVAGGGGGGGGGGAADENSEAADTGWHDGDDSLLEGVEDTGWGEE